MKVARARARLRRARRRRYGGLPSTLEGVGAAAVQVQVRVCGAGDDPQHRSDDQVERPLHRDVFARNEISMASLRFVLDECERMLQTEVVPGTTARRASRRAAGVQ